MSINAKELLNYDVTNMDQLRETLTQDGYNLLYGDTYSIKEVRNLIKAKNPVFFESENGNLLMVGENPDSLVVYNGGQTFAIKDKQLQKAWTGNIVAVLDKRDQMSNFPTDDKKAEFVIFDPDRDRWDSNKETILQRAKIKIADIKNLPEALLPDHPVIVVFDKATEKEAKDKVRAVTIGAQIRILDSADPVTEFLHELGHVYYDTRVNESEKKEFEKVFKGIDKKNPPGIFLANWDFSHPEEVFATVYYWYMRGLLSNGGYLKILEQQFLEGFKIMSSIFDRVKNDINTNIMHKAEVDRINTKWQQNERGVLTWINSLLREPTSTLIKGRGLMKAFLPGVVPEPMLLPDNVGHDVLVNLGDRDWVQVKDGLLKDKILVLKAGYLDTDYMEKRDIRYNHLPIKRLKQSGDKNIIRLSYLKPETFFKAQKTGLVPVKISVSRGGKTFMQTVWKKVSDLSVDQKKQTKWFDGMLDFFGFSRGSEVKQKIEKDFIEEDISTKFDVNVLTWTEHFLEYFKNKPEWNEKFEKNVKEQSPGSKKLDKKKIERKKKESSQMSLAIPEKETYDLTLMKYVWSNYRNKSEDKKVVSKPSSHIAEIGGMILSKYTDGSIILTGDTSKNLTFIQELKASINKVGIWDRYRKGWIFPATFEKTILEKLRQGLLGENDKLEEQVSEIVTDKIEVVAPEDTVDSSPLPPPAEPEPASAPAPVEESDLAVAEPKQSVQTGKPSFVDKIFKYEEPDKSNLNMKTAYPVGTVIEGQAAIGKSWSTTAISGKITKAYMYDPQYKGSSPYLVYEVDATYKGAFGKFKEVKTTIIARHAKEQPRLVVHSEDNFDSMPEDFSAIRKLYGAIRTNQYYYDFGDRGEKAGQSKHKAQVTRNKKLFEAELSRFEITDIQKAALTKSLEKMFGLWDKDQVGSSTFAPYNRPDTLAEKRDRQERVDKKVQGIERMKSLADPKVKIGTAIQYVAEMRDHKFKLVQFNTPTVITEIDFSENSIQYGYISPKGGTGFFSIYPDKKGRDKFPFEILPEDFDMEKYAEDKLKAIREEADRKEREKDSPVKGDKELNPKDLEKVKKAAEQAEKNFDDTEKMRVLKEALSIGTVIRFKDSISTGEVIDRIVVKDLDGSPIVQYLIKDDSTKRVFKLFRTDVVRATIPESKFDRREREIKKAMAGSSAETRAETKEALNGEPDSKISDNEVDYATGTYSDPELRYKEDKLTIGGMSRSILNYADIPNDKIRLISAGNILKAERPAYIPEVALGDFKGAGYRIPAFRIGPDRYGFRNANNKLVVGTLAIAAATQDYYLKKAKAEDKIVHNERRENYAVKLRERGLSEESVEYAVNKNIGKSSRLKVLKNGLIRKTHLKEAATVMQLSDSKATTNAFDAVMAVKQKISDLTVQTNNFDSTYSKGRITSYGKTNVSSVYQEELGVLVKRQNGDQINPGEAKQIESALKDAYKVFGNRSELAKRTELIISHAGGKFMHASEAMGMFLPGFGAIGVSGKMGGGEFNLTLAHEFAHYMDHQLGRITRHMQSSDKEGSDSNEIAVTFRDNMTGVKIGGKGKETYVSSTTECFARAMEQYFALESGRTGHIHEQNETMGTFMKDDSFEQKVKPLIEKWLDNNNDLLKAFISGDPGVVRIEYEKREMKKLQKAQKSSKSLLTKITKIVRSGYYLRKLMFKKIDV